jgi:hypothetical protein
LSFGRIYRDPHVNTYSCKAEHEVAEVAEEDQDPADADGEEGRMQKQLTMMRSLKNPRMMATETKKILEA